MNFGIILAVFWGSVTADCPARNIVAGQSILQRKMAIKKAPDVSAAAEPLATPLLLDREDSVEEETHAELDDGFAKLGDLDDSDPFQINNTVRIYSGRTVVQEYNGRLILTSWNGWKAGMDGKLEWMEDSHAHGSGKLSSRCTRDLLAVVPSRWSRIVSPASMSTREVIGFLSTNPLTVRGGRMRPLSSSDASRGDFS